MLRIVKSQLGSSMGQNHLNNLALLYYHYDIEITPKEVVEEFARQHLLFNNTTVGNNFDDNNLISTNLK